MGVKVRDQRVKRKVVRKEARNLNKVRKARNLKEESKVVRNHPRAHTRKAHTPRPFSRRKAREVREEVTPTPKDLQPSCPSEKAARLLKEKTPRKVAPEKVTPRKVRRPVTRKDPKVARPAVKRRKEERRAASPSLERVLLKRRPRKNEQPDQESLFLRPSHC